MMKLIALLLVIVLIVGCTNTEKQDNTNTQKSKEMQKQQPVQKQTSVRTEEPPGTDYYPENYPNENEERTVIPSEPATPPSQNIPVEVPAQVQPAVSINGNQLSSAQIDEFVRVYGRIYPGEYWYDTQSGLVGRIGYPAEAQIYPGYNYGQLQRDSSNGNTGVLINGREATESEVQYLESIIGVQRQAGGYYLDAYGNFGNDYAGYVNLYSTGRGTNNAYSQNSGSSSWNSWATDSYGGSQGGCTYVATDSGTATSGCG